MNLEYFRLVLGGALLLKIVNSLDSRRADDRSRCVNGFECVIFALGLFAVQHSPTKCLFCANVGHARVYAADFRENAFFPETLLSLQEFTP